MSCLRVHVCRVLILLWVVTFSLCMSVSGEPRNSSQTVSRESPAASGSETIQPAGKDAESDPSPVLGGGVRTPPDIGAAGTASSTPSIRSESPTDEPQMLPSESPDLPEPSDSSASPEKNPSSTSPLKEAEPLGQPDFLKK